MAKMTSYELSNLYLQKLKDFEQKPSEWIQFLKTASNVFKYEFVNQVLIYAQRPQATACAEFNIWAKTMNAYIKKYSSGIGILKHKSNLSYVFDIQDIRFNKKSRKPYLWKIDPSNHVNIIFHLESTYNVSNRGNIDFKNDLKKIVEHIIKKKHNLDSDQEKFVTNSVLFMLLQRCDVDAEKYFTTLDFHMENFSFIHSDFRNMADIISTTAKEILIEVGHKVKQLDTEKEAEKASDLIIQKIVQPEPTPNLEPIKNSIEELSEHIQKPYMENDIIWIDSKKHTIVSIDNDVITFQDNEFPLIQNEATRVDFEKKLQEDERNNFVLSVKNQKNEVETNVPIIKDLKKKNEVEQEAAFVGLTVEEYLSNEQLEIEGQTYQVDSYNSDFNRAILKDTTSTESDNFPILRVVDTHLVNDLFKKQKEEKNVIHEDNTIPIKNFKITDAALGHGGAKTKYQNNISAILLLRKLEKENRFANQEEQNILSKYVGWGGLSAAFDSKNESWKKEYKELKSLLSEKEYTSARESTLNAHYTSPEIIEFMFKKLEDMGFKNGNILEPSMGVGNFFGMIPNSMIKANLYGVELDDLSGRIAKKLYPKSKISISGFEKTNFQNDFFDIAIGNVPFGDYKVSDKDFDKHKFMIHDYFFAKSLEKVRAGGIIAFITSKGTMDKKDLYFREYMAQRADLLGAVRLPNNAFLGNAGTEVTSDILFFQKRDNMNLKPNVEWLHLAENEDGILMNNYFIKHPEMIVGTMEMKLGAYGYASTCQPFNDGKSLSEHLSEIKIEGKIKTNISLKENMENTKTNIPAQPDIKNFSYTVIDGKIYYRENSIMTFINKSKKTNERIKDMVELRNSLNELINLQLYNHSDEEIQATQRELNSLYDNFSKNHGLINSKANRLAFEEDSSYYLLCSLEDMNPDGTFNKKADIFKKRTIKNKQIPTQVDTAIEALILSISERARIDFEYMTSLTGKSDKEIKQELSGIIFKNPETSEWESGDEYLVGNVREKLRIAEDYAEAVSEEYNINVEMLKKVQPEYIQSADIDVRLGATWIPAQYIDKFMEEVLQTPKYHLKQGTIKTNFSNVNSQWRILGKNSDPHNMTVNNVFGTPRINGYKILEETLNLKNIQIFDTIEDEHGNDKRVINKKETIIATQKQDALKEAFKEWLFTDTERRKELTDLYNELFNSYRLREYNGDHLNFIGMNSEIDLRKHQRDAVARILYGGNTLLAHCVGAGKTYTMIAASQESKRLGLSQKSLFVVPNHLTEQWASDFLKLYPSANILAATKKDFKPQNRKKFCSKIATGNYDAVIIGHTQFEKIPLSSERKEAFIRNQINSITEEIAKLDAESGNNFSVKNLEKTKRRLEYRLDVLIHDEKKDDVITFEQLGIDRLYVDESHAYKNLYLYTKMRNVAGIGQSESQRAIDMQQKCQYIDEITGGKGITFATGTPISNSMTELYTNMRFLQQNRLKEMGLTHFDNWASIFGETTTALELTPEGNGYRMKTRFAKFHNLPELMTVFKECADIQTADMLKLPVPEVEYHNIVLKPSYFQKDVLKTFAYRADTVKNGSVDARIDNMLKITHDGRNLALDQRLYDPNLPEEDDSKINACVENCFHVYQETMDKKSTQLIFCDISTPKKGQEDNFTIYAEVKSKLIEKGVPEKEIAFIHDANTDKQKSDLFAKVRSGEVRFLLGSTSKMGAGTNVQDKLIALHHLDVPWRPSDIEQQEGRILRQGNENKKVHIYRYVTENTFDSYSWQTIENKQKFISQIMTSKTPVRSCEDISEAALNYAEVKALATGNPYIKEKMELDNQVSQLKLLKANFLNEKYKLEDNLVHLYPERIAKSTEKIKLYTDDFQLYNTMKEQDSFSMKVGKNTFFDKKKAGEALIQNYSLLNNKAKDGSITIDKLPIGKYMGFDMNLSYSSFQKKFYLEMKNNATYTVSLGNDPHGNITRINNVLDNIPERIVEEKNKLAETEIQIKNTKTALLKKFNREDELQIALKRLSELNTILKINESLENENLIDSDMDMNTKPIEKDKSSEKEQKYPKQKMIKKQSNSHQI